MQAAILRPGGHSQHRRRGVLLTSLALAAAACAHAGARQPSAPHANRGFWPDPSARGIECPSGDEPRALGALEAQCRRDPACGCALYGRALLEDDRHASEALRVLEDACHRGALDACDDGLLAASICGLERDQHRPRRELCELLDAAGLLPPPEPPEVAAPPLEAVGISAAFEGCFVAAAPLAGTAFCFDADRWFERAPGKPWDQRLAAWKGRRGETSIATDDVALSLEGGKVTVSVEGASAELTRMTAADERTAFTDAAAVGKVEVLCARARACVAAVARMVPPVESDAPYEDPFTSAQACLDAQSDARRSVKQPPPECR